MSKFKVSPLDRNNIVSMTGAGIYAPDSVCIGPVIKGGSGNCIVSSGSGEYDGGDRVIGFHNGYDIDGDILISVGWGDGIAVRRLNNDGSMTKLYHDNNGLWRDTTSTYNHMQSVAMAKGCNKAVVMSYNVYGYSIIDYSGAVDGTSNGGAVIREARPTHTNPTDFVDATANNDRSNGYLRRAGYWYAGGLCAAGEWIYGSSHDAIHYKKYPRRNLATGAEEMLGVADKKSGTADEDRNGYRAFLSYDEVNDRMYYWNYEGDGSFTVIFDASTASPELVWCDYEDTVTGDSNKPSTYAVDGHARESGMFIPDPVNAPNVVIAPGNDYIYKLDYTPCLSGNPPNILQRTYLRSFNITDEPSANGSGIDFNGITRFGTKYQKTSGTPMDKLPDYTSTYIPLSGDRGYGTVDGGFLNLDLFKIYSRKSLTNYQEDQSSVYGGSARGRSWQSSYGVNMVLMESANGTKYWIRMGYGSDGHSFRIYTEATKPMELCGNWEIVFGTFTLDNSANVDLVHVSNLDQFYIPTNCSLTVYVSNNNGSSWETYDSSSDIAHIFSSTGNQLRVKLSAGGHPDKAPFYQRQMGLSCSYSSLHEAAKDSNVKFKVTRKKLRS